MKKLFLLVGLILLGGIQVCFSQEEEAKPFIHHGLLRSMATISSGLMLNKETSPIYIHGNLEYYLANNVSIRGDIFYLVTKEKTAVSGSGGPAINYYMLDYNHSSFAGASYHFPTKSNFDPYISFEPGVAFSQTSLYLLDSTWSPEKFKYKAVNPLLSCNLGFNFYFQKLFHLFCEARYINGKHLSDAATPFSLDEFRFSFGLGLNFDIFKQKTAIE